jgi:Lrp/AsnC family transcriptional regulator, leucine-responsive regulatory protein
MNHRIAKKNCDNVISQFLELDRIDRKILNILQTNNQITNNELAELVGISASPCLRRVRKLRELGVITQDVSLVDPKKVGRNFIVFLNISLERQREDLLEHFERKVMQHPEVMQCYFVSGDFDYFVVLMVSDVQEYHDFVRRVFANDPNIKVFRSSFALNRVKYSTKIALKE